MRVGDDERVTFLVGAGASAPPPSSIPTVGSLLPKLWRGAERSHLPELRHLKEWCDSHDLQNIEDLLTGAYIANVISRSDRLTALVRYLLFSSAAPADDAARSGDNPSVTPYMSVAAVSMFEDALQTLFGLLTSTMIQAAPNPAHMALARFLATAPTAKVVTTNYDVCMEEALLQVTGATSAPAGPLLKMHGSVHASYCRSCQDIREHSIDKLKEALNDDALSFPVVGLCKRCQGQTRPLLVPPISIKFMMFPNLVSVWHDAQEAIESADVIVAVGYSFPKADSYLTGIVTRSMAEHPDQRLVVCDREVQLVPALRARWEHQIDDFESESRILAAVGSCVESVPEVLTALTTETKTGGPVDDDIPF